jgi:hypothetical protein
MRGFVSSLSGASRAGSRVRRRRLLGALALLVALQQADAWLVRDRGVRVPTFWVDLGRPAAFQADKIDDHRAVTRRSVMAMLVRLSSPEGFGAMPEGRQLRLAQTVAQLDSEYHEVLWLTLRLLEIVDASCYEGYGRYFADPLAMGDVVRTEWRWFGGRLEQESNPTSTRPPKARPVGWEPSRDPELAVWSTRYVEPFIGQFREDHTLRTQSKVLILSLLGLDERSRARLGQHRLNQALADATALCTAAERLDSSWNLLLEWLNNEPPAASAGPAAPLQDDASFSALLAEFARADQRMQVLLARRARPGVPR